MNKSVKQILSYAQLAVHQDCPDEILYGTAGYLYSLLILHTKLQIDLSKEILKICDHLFTVG